jgi:hypothetical protein
MADLTQLRSALRTADAAVAQALYQRSRTASAATQAALTIAQQAARTSKTALNTALAAFVQPGIDSAASLQGNLPIVLFPLRLETRFARARGVVSGGGRVATGFGRAATPSVASRVTPTGLGVVAPLAAAPVGVLQIRVYPDELLAQTHESELTDDEWQAGRAYWSAGDVLASWTALLARFSPQRAAWIVRQSQTPTRPPARAASWTRPATAVMPDNFAAFAYRGGVLVASGVGLALAEPVTLTMSPALDSAQRVAVSGSTFQVDTDLLWTLDFTAAKAAGMGLELPVSAVDWTQGFDLVVVVGTKGTFSVAEASQQIQSIFDGHHYTRGLALVSPGTPTSNLPDAPSGFPVSDPSGATSFTIERGTPATGDDALLASALGLSADVLAHVEHTGLQTDAAAQAMLTALWPATLGYHLEQMMAPADSSLLPPYDATAVAAAYDYTRVNVRPGGPLPAFRVGSVPYAVAPVTSLTRMAGTPPVQLTNALSALRATLLTASDQAHRINPTSTDPDGDLVNVLRLDASAKSFLVQVLIGSQLQILLGLLPGLSGSLNVSAQGLQGGIADAQLRSLGLPAANTPRIALASFGTPEPFFGVLISSAADRQAPLPAGGNYIHGHGARGGRSAGDLRADAALSTVAPCRVGRTSQSGPSKRPRSRGTRIGDSRYRHSASGPWGRRRGRHCNGAASSATSSRFPHDRGHRRAPGARSSTDCRARTALHRDARSLLPSIRRMDHVARDDSPQIAARRERRRKPGLSFRRLWLGAEP